VHSWLRGNTVLLIAGGGFTEPRARLIGHFCMRLAFPRKRELHYGRQRQWRCARTDPKTRDIGLQARRKWAADHANLPEKTFPGDVDSRARCGNGRQRRDPWWTKSRYATRPWRARCRRRSGSRAEMFGVFARDSLRKDIRHVRTEDWWSARRK